MKNQKIISSIALVLAVIVIISIAGYSAWLKRDDTNIADTSNWETYRNEKYGYELKYPQGWQAMMIINGYHVVATNSAEILSIETKNGVSSISFDVSTLVSGRLGSYFASAKNLSEYLNLKNIDSNGNTVRELVKVTTIAGQQAYWYKNKDRSLKSWLQGWLQKGNNIYEIWVNSTFENTSDQILSTFKFTSSPITCVPEGEMYGAPLKKEDLCCSGLVQRPSPDSQSGTFGTCEKP